MNPEQVVAAALFLLLASAIALSTAALASLSDLMLFSRSSAFSSRAVIWVVRCGCCCCSCCCGGWCYSLLEQCEAECFKCIWEVSQFTRKISQSPRKISQSTRKISQSTREEQSGLASLIFRLSLVTEKRLNRGHHLGKLEVSSTEARLTLR